MHSNLSRTPDKIEDGNLPDSVRLKSKLKTTWLLPGRSGPGAGRAPAGSELLRALEAVVSALIGSFSRTMLIT